MVEVYNFPSNKVRTLHWDLAALDCRRGKNNKSYSLCWPYFFFIKLIEFSHKLVSKIQPVVTR